MKTYRVVGVMSGTSMDGIDLAHCDLTQKENGKWDYTINAVKNISYNDAWRLRLSKLRNQNVVNVYKTDRYYGEYIGQLINEFLVENDLSADLIGSHGHTILHQPKTNMTFQVGSGAAISAVTGLPAVSNFRAIDVVKFGEGAPISGIGDRMMFSEFDVCLNLGGFANLSAEVEGSAVAYDICPCNILLNRIAREFGKEFDEGGQIAEQGHVDYDLLADLNNIKYYHEPYPKSLGREWINENFWFRVRESKSSKEDRMKTLCDHIGEQVGTNIDELVSDPTAARVFVSGGGAFNPVLIDHIKTHTDAEIIIPEPELVSYKEALIFALMGVLRVRNEVNIYASFTGADSDSVAGELHGDFSQLI